MLLKHKKMINKKTNNKKRNRINIKLIVWIILLVLMMQCVFALGITPSRKIIKYEPGLKQDLELLVINNEHKDLKLLVYAQGELSNYVNLDYELITMRSDEESKLLFYSLELEEDELKPGKHEIGIVVLEFESDEQETEEAAVIKSTAALISQIILEVPYAGKYAEATLNIESGEQWENVRFVMPVFNFGTEDILNASAVIHIFGPTNELVGETVSNSISIPVTKQGDLKANWNAEVYPGYYRAVADITYDEKKTRIEQIFTVGSPTVLIKEIKINDFDLGEIVKFDIDLYNNWNSEIKDLYGELIVRDENLNLVSQTKTPATTLNPLSNGFLFAYWDTKNALIGKYNLLLNLYYSDKKIDKEFEMILSPNSADILSTTGQVTGIKQSKWINTLLIMAIVMILVIINGIMIYFAMRRKLKQKPYPIRAVNLSNTRLEKYISRTLSKGVNEAEIIKKLKNMGWDEDIIKQNMNEAKLENLEKEENK